MGSLYRKLARGSVRAAAEKTGKKPSAAVFRWRKITNAYPNFHGSKHPTRHQPILTYPPVTDKKSPLWRFM